MKHCVSGGNPAKLQQFISEVFRHIKTNRPAKVTLSLGGFITRHSRLRV
jgi:hypothetical protein